MSISHTIEQMADLHGPRVAFADEQYEITFKALDTATRNLAVWLTSKGAKPRDRIGVFLPRSVQAVLAYLGGIRCGLNVFPLSDYLVKEENSAVLHLLNPSFVFCDDSHAELMSKRVKRACSACEVVFNSIWRDAVKSSKPADFDEPPLLPDDIVYYNMTSGTSGIPKFAATSQRNLICNTEAVQSVFPAGSDDVYLCLFPIDLHPHEHFMRTIMTGCKTVLVESRYPRSIMDIIRRHEVTWLKAAPVMIDLLSNHLLRNQSAPVVFMKYLEISGATDEKQLSRWNKCFGSGMYRVWGSTETTGVVFSCSGDELYDHTLLGRPLSGYQADIWDADDKRVDEGQTGRLMIRGNALFAGYLSGSGEELSGRVGGWHETGDLACRDNSGNYYFRGRARDILKIAGKKVFVGAIETALMKIKGVREAAVVRAADPKREDIAVAFVALDDGAALTEQDILKSCSKQRLTGLAPHRVVVLRRLPLTSGGKTDYNRLIERCCQK